MARILRLALVLVGSLALGYVAVVAFVANEVTRTERSPVRRGADSIARGSQPVAFRAEDGVTLRGWFFPGTNGRAAVLVHGKESNRADGDHLYRVARILADAGYGLLLFDLRASGESDGARFSLGQHESLDVAAAVDHLVGRGIPPEKIALVGESMGASTAVLAVARRPAVGAVVADSAYADGPTVVAENATRETGLPSFFTPGIVLAAKILFGLDTHAVDPRAVVRAHPEKAFLFIHGEADRLVPLHHARDLKAASANPRTELWIVPGAEHCEASRTEPVEYARRVLGFLDRELVEPF